MRDQVIDECIAVVAAVRDECESCDVFNQDEAMAQYGGELAAGNIIEKLNALKKPPQSCEAPMDTPPIPTIDYPAKTSILRAINARISRAILWLWAIWFLVAALSGCSRFVADSRDESETIHLLFAADARRDDRPLAVRADEIEDALFGNEGHFRTDHGPKPWYAQMRHADDDPTQWSYTNVSDAASSSHYLVGGLMWHLDRLRRQRPVDAIALAQCLVRLDHAWNYVDTLARISGKPGLVIRGFVPTDLPFDKDADNKWTDVLEGEFAGLSFRADASPGQFVGVAMALQLFHHYGPERYREASAANLHAMARFLRDNDWKIVDLDGELTQVSDFDVTGALPIGIGLPGHGWLGVYINGFSFAFENRARRNLTLLTILRAAAGAGNDHEIIDIYMQAAWDMAKRTRNAPFNFFGAMLAGDELWTAFQYFSLLDPRMDGGLDDDWAKDYYRAGFAKIMDWTDGGWTHAWAIFINAYLSGNWNAGQIQRAVDWLRSYPNPLNRVEVVNSNREDIELGLWATISWPPEPLAHPDFIVPLTRGRPASANSSRDPRRLDATASSRMFAGLDFNWAIRFGQWIGAIE